MAKNVQIIPDSGSLDFQNNDITQISMEIDTSTGKLITKAGSTTLLEISDGLINVGNSAKLVLPVVAGTPPGVSTGDLWYDSTAGALKVRGASSTETGGGVQGPIGPGGAQGPIGPKGNTGSQGPIGVQGPQGPIGPKGNIGPLGPKGNTGAQGPIGNIGPQGPIGPKGNIGPLGPKGSIGPKGTSAPSGLTTTVGESPSLSFTNGVLTAVGG